MDLDCPGMDAETAKAHAVKVAEGAGFVGCLPVEGELVKGHAPRNWWRELVTETWSDANAVWEARMEEETFMYETEMAEYAEANPRPTLKTVMQGLKGAAA